MEINNFTAMIDFISSMRNCHIFTIEDPIEYVYQQKQALIHQREVYEALILLIQL